MQTKKKVSAEERINEVYEPEVIPDRAEELIKKAEEANIRQHEQALIERRHRQDLKQKRILAAKEDKFTHAINLIVERVKYQNNPSFSIDFYDFNFEDTMDNLRVLLGFLNSLVASGCLKSYSKTSYTGGVRINFNGANIVKLTEFRDKRPLPQPEPTLTKITEMPKLQVEGLKELANAKKKDNKPKFPYKLPAGARWKELIIKFLDEEDVYIQIKQFKLNTSYRDMGFVGKGNVPNPSEAWVFLRVLSKLNGELAITDKEARDRYKKQKELLAKALQSYFSIDYDPFYPYHSSSEKSGNSYKIKITLIPPPEKGD